jgi:hypothetical protein
VQLELRDGTSHTTHIDKPDDYEAGAFQTTYISLDPETVFRRPPSRGAREMTTVELRQEIADAQLRNDPAHEARFMIQQKLSLSLACPILALIGLALGATNRKDGKLASFAIGMGVIFLYYLLLWGARAAAMGEAFGAVADDATAVYWNPAGLGRVRNGSLSVMHALWLEDVAYDWLSYAHPLGRQDTVGIGIQYLSYGSLKDINAAGVENGSFTPNDLAVSLAYAHAFGRLSLGASAKYISSDLQKTASAYAADAGALYTLPDERFSFGLAVQNMGTKMTFINESITGFAIVSGDLHSFWAGYASAQLPPGKFEPVGLSFTGGSMSSVGGGEANEYTIKKDNKFRPLYLADRPGAAKPESTYNMLLTHGVRSCFEYAKSFDRAKARALSNPDVAPHLKFVDIGGHGYATVRLTGDEMRTEFVCIPPPIARATTPDGGPLRYRIAHTAKLWRAGERPQLAQEVIEGDPGLSI